MIFHRCNGPHVPPIDVVGNNVWIDVFQPCGNGSVLAFFGHGEFHEMLEAFFLGGVAEMVVSKSEGVIGVVVFKNEGMVGFPVVESIHDVLSSLVDAGVFDGPVVEECP